jgi:diadenosine tetraphosphate (Ap4A) HIT family hydrolase
MKQTFQVDLRLAESSTFITQLALSQVRLSHNAAFPWLLLIPQQDSLIEVIDLSPHDQHLLIQEIALVSQVMQKLFHPDKLNIATLGNLVPQLHIHIIARYQNDGAWPHPVWNSGVMKNYEPEQKLCRIDLIQTALRQAC